MLRTPDTGWVWRLALRLGEDGRVVSPPALVAEIRCAAAAALENYGITSPGDGFSPAELPGSAAARPGGMTRTARPLTPAPPRQDLALAGRRRLRGNQVVAR